MAVTININGISLVHEDSGGVAKATLPDVCKTQVGNAIVPVPYPNIAKSSDLKNGTKTVKVDGGNPVAIQGSEFSKSTGDKAGKLGGVKSGVNEHRATWLTYSFDVTFEGEGVCRLTDKMFMNNGNTVCLGGIVNPPVLKPPQDPKCAELYKKIYELIYAIRSQAGKGPKGMAIRWNEAATNRGGWTKAQNETHMQAYKNDQRAVNKRLEKWRDAKCNDDDLPPGTKVAADKVPELGSKKGWDQAVAEFSQSKSSMSGVEGLSKALGVSVGVAIAIEVITRIIRCFPPLLPLQASPI